METHYRWRHLDVSFRKCIRTLISLHTFCALLRILYELKNVVAIKMKGYVRKCQVIWKWHQPKSSWQTLWIRWKHMCMAHMDSKYINFKPIRHAARAHTHTLQSKILYSQLACLFWEVHGNLLAFEKVLRFFFVSESIFFLSYAFHSHFAWEPEELLLFQ